MRAHGLSALACVDHCVLGVLVKCELGPDVKKYWKSWYVVN
jgi:hypothetical protein